MKALRIIIVAFILITVGIFIYLTAGTDAETLTGLPILYLGVFILLKIRQNRRKKFKHPSKSLTNSPAWDPHLSGLPWYT